MLISMTGFGKAEAVYNGRSIHVSIRSVNSKSVDVGVRVPLSYRDKEHELRGLIIESLERGKIDLMIVVDKTLTDEVQTVNKAVLQNYVEQFRAAVSDQVSEDRIFAAASRLPNVMSGEKDAFDEDEWKVVVSCTKEAIQQLAAFRQNEGHSLQKDLTDRIHAILNSQLEIQKYEGDRVAQLRGKIEKQLNDLNGKENVDRDRFEQEMIYYLERLDITEENVRLKTHCEYFQDTMKNDGSQGKKLNFIAQEIGREINTIGSKANHAAMQMVVVEMKDELEKIKEQLQNVL